jgi:predicted AAA+ superfamily ATPase
VSLGELLTGSRPAVTGHTDHRLEDYAIEILASGFPGLRGFQGRALGAQLDGYLTRIVDRDFPELGHSIRNPAALQRWMRAYAAASSTSASFEKIRDAASAGHTEKPAKSTTIPYRDALERLWILDPVPAWLPSRNRIARLSVPPKHQLADPALAARLLGVDLDGLLSAKAAGPPIPREGTLLGALFESLVTLSVRVYAQAAEAKVSHLRTAAGAHEVDLIVERANGGIVAIEVKLARDVGENDTRHLKWLAEKIGEELLDAIVITTGQDAYRRRDGIAIIPAGLLGP